MSKEADFLIYCMERYRYLKKLSGADVAKIFEKYDFPAPLLPSIHIFEFK